MQRKILDGLKIREHALGARHLHRAEELAVSRRIAEVKSRLQRLNPVDARPDYNRTFGDLVALEQRRKALVEKAAGAF